MQDFLQQMKRGRVLLVFAHPDDESVAMAAQLGGLSRAHLLHVTDGAPRNGSDSLAYGFATTNEYRDARTAELTCAMQAAGAASTTRSCLKVPDQEASLCLAELTLRIQQQICQHRPGIVVTHPYEGGHPDHDACAFAVHHAVAACADAPAIVEAAFYHGGPHGIETGCFLPSAQHTDEVRLQLSPNQEAVRRKVFDCFSTQRDTLQYFPRDHESFRTAPVYDFLAPPHAGAVFYDGYLWGMTSQRFCQLARVAVDELCAGDYPCR